jgi:hypothetical protein
MTRTFDGPESGAGAIYAWEGNDDVGTGKMTITSSTSPGAIEIELAFIEPFPSTSKTEFRFDEQDGSTTVTWTMSGDNDFMGKAFSLFMDMDTLIGGDFDKGLANLKSVAESAPSS